MSKTTLTPAQRRAFFSTVRQAAQELGEDPEVYRQRILKEELGVEHLADVRRGFDYDRLMARACRDSGDFDRAIKYAGGGAKRLKHLIVGAAEKIVAKKGDWTGTAYDYIAGVMIQCGMVQGRPAVVAAQLESGSGWDRFDEGQLRRLLIMLATHLNRVKSSRGSEVRR